MDGTSNATVGASFESSLTVFPFKLNTPAALALPKQTAASYPELVSNAKHASEAKEGA
jgi:hypothetical protein|tara:strand:+ start:965 stop:1138 length:174 start_codon:yes stop_codon:yes gene_type:complete